MGIKFEDVLNSTTVADDIAVESLLWHYREMQDNMKDFEENENTTVHPEDYVAYVEFTRSFENVLKYYGR